MTETMRVPFVDLKAQYDSIKTEIDGAIAEVIAKTAFIKGHFVREFEEKFAKACGMAHCVGTGNGTDSLFIVMKMLGIGPGDEVITSANSWIATSETISLTGAKPVFVDVEPDFHCLDHEKLEEKITPATKAVIPVHLYGQPARMDKICGICKRHGLAIIEDCAQAHFAKFEGRLVGSLGRAASFSFYPSKNLGAYGDAGCILTNDADLAKQCRLFANHGTLDKLDHLIEGVNSRPDGIQAAILLAKLPHILDWNAARRKNAAIYDSLLGGIQEISTPKIRPGAEHVFHIYAIKCKERDSLRERLASRGIETAIHYPVMLPFMTAYKKLNLDPADYPNAMLSQRELLSLPMFPELTREQIERVAGEIRSFYGR